jgi:hypothetical protein
MFQLSQFLNIYTFEFLEPNVKQLASTYEEYPRETSLIIPQESKYTIADIYESLLQRIPISMKGSVWSMLFDESKLPYTIEEAKTSQCPFLRYTLCAKAYTYKNSFFYCFHTFAPNFESQNTDDSKTFLNENGYIQRDLYKPIIQQLVRMIAEASLQYECDECVLPCIGLGNYANCVHPDDKDYMINLFMNFLQSMPIPYKVFSPNSIRSDTVKDDIFRYISDTHTHHRIGVVNAWDTHSFIGNGGTQDNSFDGWFVSGFGSGSVIPNTSVLHNPFINSEIFNPANWIYV